MSAREALLGGFGWNDVDGSLEMDPYRRRRPRILLCVTALILVIFLTWAANASLEEYTRGTGEVVPLSRGQIIQSLEGGILQEVTVREGEEVEAGQTVAVIDNTRVLAAYEDLEGQTIALRAALSRLNAELAGADHVTFDKDVAAAQKVVQAERELFEARRRKQVETVASLKERIALAEEELALVRPLVERGAASAVKQIELERSIADLRGQLTEVQNAYFQEVNEAIAKRGAELASLTQQLTQRRDELRRTVLRSPVRGIVKNLEVTTRGGVIGGGEEIMEIVPLDDQLFIEAKIRPQDVAFLHPGQLARVKITAYDFNTYGMLTGELVYVSADTIIDETRTDAEPFYRVRILTDSASLEGPDGPLPIIPGMVAEVNILTGEKTVLDYLLKPILRGQEAMRER